MYVLNLFKPFLFFLLFSFFCTNFSSLLLSKFVYFLKTHKKETKNKKFAFIINCSTYGPIKMTLCHQYFLFKHLLVVCNLGNGQTKHTFQQNKEGCSIFFLQKKNNKTGLEKNDRK